ncbi:hypothetical protein HHUSO_G4775 [Huso huso]|uniref:Uncharacterized protein n=1 Tax=Huso huso TaxID=61971 RepID=A0ABR0ZZM7_HUSHU
MDEEALYPTYRNDVSNDNCSDWINNRRNPVYHKHTEEGVGYSFQVNNGARDVVEDATKPVANKGQFGYQEPSVPKIIIRKTNEEEIQLLDYQPCNKAVGGAARQDSEGYIVSRRPGCNEFAVSTEHLREIVYRKARQIVDVNQLSPLPGQKHEMGNDDKWAVEDVRKQDWQHFMPQKLEVRFTDYHPWGKPGGGARVLARNGKLLHPAGSLNSSSNKEYNIWGPITETGQKEREARSAIPKEKQTITSDANEQCLKKQQERRQSPDYYADLAQQAKYRKQQIEENKTRALAAERMHNDTMQFCTWSRPGHGVPTSQRKQSLTSADILPQEQFRRPGFSGVPFVAYGH